MQANFICFFRGGQNEVEMIAEEFQPPMVSKKEFMALIDSCTRMPFSFFTINMKVDWEKRFRQNLWPPIRVPGLHDQSDIVRNSNKVNVPQDRQFQERGGLIESSTTKR